MGSICYATYEEPIPHPSHQKKNPLDNPRDGVGELREVSQRDRYIPKFEIMDK
jgi:hypothetical protein